MPTITKIEPPALDHDAMMLARYGQTVRPEGKLERRIVANLIAHLNAAGFHVHGVWDGEEFTRMANDWDDTRRMKEAMEVIFNLDEASLRIYKDNRREWHGILLISGNGIDILSDWNYFEDDRDGFNAAMDAFDAEAFA